MHSQSVPMEIPVLLLLSIFISISIFFLHRRKRSKRGEHHHPRHLLPTPPALPILGHLHLLKPPVHRQLQNLSEKYGPVFSLRFGFRPVVIISSPSAVEECFTKNDLVFANRPMLTAGKYISYNYTTIGTAPYGEHWRHLRRIGALEIFSSKRLSMYVGSRRDEIEILLRRLSRNSRDGFAKVALRPMFTALTCNIIMRMVAGKRYYGEDVETEEARRFQRTLRQILELAGAGNPRDFIPFLRLFDFGAYERKLMKIDAEKDMIFQGLIDQHRSSDRDGENSLIHHLLELQKSEPQYYTDEIIKGFALDLTLAGTDSTATTMEWAMSLLLNHPNVLEKAKVELATHVGKDRLIEESDISKLQYLQCIISETLRLFPPGPLLAPHMSLDDCKIGEFYVPKNTILFVNAWAIHRDPKLWEDATSFRPERFETEGNDQMYKLVPFGVGRRACPASGVGNRVLGLTLGSLIQCFEWKRVDDKDVDLAEGNGLTTPKIQPLEAMCKARSIIRKIL